jgi:AraC-like DNA-binding protein
MGDLSMHPLGRLLTGHGAQGEAAMTTRILTVDRLCEADRFAYWREQWCEGTVGVTGELARDERQSFHARATTWTAPHVIRLRCETGPFQVSRGLREINRRSWQGWIWLHQEMSDGATFRHAGNEFIMRQGDLLVTDPTIPFSSRPRSSHDYCRWLLPRAWIEPHLPPSRRPLSVRLSGSHGINGLVGTYLHALDDAVDELDDAELPRIIDNFCRLVALACGGAAGDQRDAIRAAKLRQAKDYIALHLSEPDLTPAAVAAAMRISVRQLHLLFEPTGTSFAQHVLTRRLEECRAILESPSSRARSVTDIAYAWGFNNLASFYRAFRRRYGISPGEFRRVDGLGCYAFTSGQPPSASGRQA